MVKIRNIYFRSSQVYNEKLWQTNNKPKRRKNLRKVKQTKCGRTCQTVVKIINILTQRNNKISH